MKQGVLYAVLGGLAGYLLFGASSAFGMAAILVNLFTPLPAAYLGMRYGVMTGGLAVAMTATLILLSSAAPGALFMYLLQYGLASALLPWLMKRQVGWDKAVTLTLLAVVAAGVVGLIVTATVQGEGPLALAGQIVEQEVDQANIYLDTMFAGSELPPSEQEELKAAVENMAEFMRIVYAGLAIVMSGMMLFILVLLLSFCSRGNYEIPGVAFQSWKAPEPLIWILILAGFSVVIVQGFARDLAMNTLVVLLPVYFLQGLAVLDCFFRRKALSPIVRGFGYLVVTLINPLPMIVAGIGVFDMWVDFRKPRINKT